MADIGQNGNQPSGNDGGLGAQLFGFVAGDVARIGKAVSWTEKNSLKLEGASRARPALDNQCIFAKLTSRSGTVYAWSQAAPTAAGTWSTVSGGLSGTTSSYPALLTDSTDTADHTNSYAVLVRGMSTDATPVVVWIIAGLIGGGTASIPTTFTITCNDDGTFTVTPGGFVTVLTP